MSIDHEDFQFLAKMIKDYSGINLEPDKEYLMEGRLMPVAKKYGLTGIKEFAKYAKDNKNESLLIEIIEAMTTNESFFFRDSKPFDYLSKVALPELLQKFPNKEKIRIWSAACSTGQEPYSIAMSIMENPELANMKFEILATDLDFKVIEKAKEALYTQFEVQRGMPITLLLKYFIQENDHWRVKEIVRDRVKFDKFNLLESAKDIGKFDIIFCRNVLIYFDEETKKQVVTSLCDQMNPSGTLFLGTTESILGSQMGLNQLSSNKMIVPGGVFGL